MQRVVIDHTNPTAVREAVLEQAVRAGKIAASSLPEYRKSFDRDPIGTRDLIARLASVSPMIDHTPAMPAPARTAGNVGASDSVLRASQSAPPRYEGAEPVVADPRGGYMTASQAAAYQAQNALLGSYGPAATPVRTTGRVNPASD